MITLLKRHKYNPESRQGIGEKERRQKTGRSSKSRRRRLSKVQILPAN